MGGRLGIVCAVMFGAGLATLAGQAPAPQSGSAGPSAARKWVQPRTADGQPDLQGFWSNSTYVPLERPNGVTKEFYTPEEAAAIRKTAASREQAQTKPGTVDDVHYDFSQFGLDRSQAAQAPNLRTSLIIEPADGKIPPMTAEGRQRVAAREAAAKGIGRWDSAESNQLDDRCLIMAGAGPPMMDAAYNSNYHIVQAPGVVMILTEMIHDVRVIPLDGRTAPPQRVRQWMGTSRGRWEGDTLVVETSNFNGKNPFRNSSERMRVIERFRRVSDDVIMYRFTIDDPATWAAPWTGEMPMQRTSGPLFEHACHEGNFGLYNTLVGARLEEQRAAEAAGSAKK
jgi:hypothetical protein